MKKLFIVPVIAMIVSCNCKKATVAENDVKSNQPLFEVLNESQYQGRETESFEVVKDIASLNTLYRSVNLENVPAIDFKKQGVVAVFLGQKNSGGHAIKVKNAIEKEGKVYLEIEKTSPKAGENVTMAITNPYAIVKINSTNEVVVKK